LAALADAGYYIALRQDAGSQRFDELTPDKRPQDPYGDGRDWTFETGEHGGDEPDNMPQTIHATDAEGALGYLRSSYLTRKRKIVVPRQ
jgi:hypothetical protein